MPNKKNRHQTKGFTLVEVTVALGIMALALAGTFNLVVSALRLMESARENTEATALMQKGLADGTANACGYCTNSTSHNLSGYTLVGGSYQFTENGKTLTVKFNDPTTFSILSDGGTEEINNTDFIKITSTVSWGTQSTSSSQYVRKSQ